VRPRSLGCGCGCGCPAGPAGEGRGGRSAEWVSRPNGPKAKRERKVKEFPFLFISRVLQIKFSKAFKILFSFGQN
jgi:hypothetical protein